MTGTITVQGQGTATAHPDDALLTLNLQAILATAEDARADVAERSADLGHVFDELGIDERDRITTGLTVREEREYSDGKYVHRGYKAATSVRVTVRDTELIGRLMTLAVTEAEADISGPYWHIAGDNPAHTEARKEAIADARRRAQAYAEALGVRIGAVLDVCEPGLRSPDHEVISRSALFESSSMVAMDQRPPDIHVDAGELDVSCAVDVVYRVEQ